MARKPRQKLNYADVEVLCDGREFFTSPQAAQHFDLTEDHLRKLVETGHLHPGKLGQVLVFTRRDLLRYKAYRTEHEITTQLVRGLHPLDIYLEARGRWSLDQVTKVMQRWAKLTGVWIMEGPRGSYARWLARLGLVELEPRHIRRLIELLLTDAYVQKRVRVALASLGVRATRSTDEGLANAESTPGSDTAGPPTK